MSNPASYLASQKWEGGYFVSQEQSDAVLGKAHRELATDREHLRLLEIAANDLGESLERAGRALKGNFHLLGFDDEHSVAHPRFPVSVDRAAFDANRLDTLLKDVRATRERINRSKEKLGIAKEGDE